MSRFMEKKFLGTNVDWYYWKGHLSSAQWLGLDPSEPPKQYPCVAITWRENDGGTWEKACVQYVYLDDFKQVVPEGDLSELIPCPSLKGNKLEVCPGKANPEKHNWNTPDTSVQAHCLTCGHREERGDRTN